MNEIAREARFMGTVTAVTMHEMQNILAIIRESAGLMGDILKVNSRLDFKHRPNMERTVEHIATQVDRGKRLLEATSRMAHSPDDDVLEGCDLAVYARTAALLAERPARLKGAAVEFTAPGSALPVAVGALPVLMCVYRAVLLSLPAEVGNVTVRLETEPGQDEHVLKVRPPEGIGQSREGLDELNSLLGKGRAEWDGSAYRLIFPVRKQD
jgi:hypothetical protein